MRIAFASKGFISGQQINFKVYDQDANIIFDNNGLEWGSTGIYYIDILLSPLIHYLVIASEANNAWQATKYILGGLDYPSGDMLKSDYDKDSNLIIDMAESINDGNGHIASAEDIQDAISKKHSHTGKSSVYVYRNLSNQPISNLIYTKVIWHTKARDILNEFDLNDNKYIASVSGKRLIIINVYGEAIADKKLIKLCIYKNGTVFKSVSNNTTGTTSSSLGINIIIDMIAGDYIEFFLYHNTGATRDLYASEETNFMYIEGL